MLRCIYCIRSSLPSTDELQPLLGFFSEPIKIHVTLELFGQLEKIRIFFTNQTYLRFCKVLNVLVIWAASIISCRPKHTKFELSYDLRANCTTVALF